MAPHRCSFCNIASATKSCSQCGTAWYCTAQCQRSHWKNGHKTECQPRPVESVTSSNESDAKPIAEQGEIERLRGRVEGIVSTLKTIVNLEDVADLFEKYLGIELELPVGVSLLSLVETSNVLDMMYTRRQTRRVIYIKSSVDDEGSDHFDIDVLKGKKAEKSSSLEEIENHLLDAVSRQGSVVISGDTLTLFLAGLEPTQIETSQHGFATFDTMVDSFSQLVLHRESNDKAYIHMKQPLEIVASRIRYLVSGVDSADLHTPEGISKRYLEQFKEPLNYFSVGHDSVVSLLSFIPELCVERQGGRTIVYTHTHDNDESSSSGAAEFKLTDDMRDTLLASGYGAGTPLTGLKGIFGKVAKVHEVAPSGKFACLVKCNSILAAWMIKNRFQGKRMYGSAMTFQFFCPEASVQEVATIGTEWSKVAAKPRKVVEHQVTTQLTSTFSSARIGITRNLHVSGFNPSTTKEDIERAFKRVTKVKSVHLMYNFAFVNTPDKACADEAMQALDQTFLNGGKLRIKYAKEKGEEGRSFW